MTQPTSIIIYGASGDLCRRKLIPGLYNLFVKGRLPEKFNIVGFSRTDLTETFPSMMKEAVAVHSSETFDENVWREFEPALSYFAGSFGELEVYQGFAEYLGTLEGGEAHRLYYLSVAPRFFLSIVQDMKNAGMLTQTEQHWRRVIVEKPFGHDLKSAQELNAGLHACLDESQIYRIDHYLAKETVQNLLVFRFANAIFEPLWNRQYIEHIQITATETVDVQHRAGYYDRSGVMRDMFQNHLMQLLALVAMEPPSSFEANAVRDEKIKVLRALQPIPPERLSRSTVRAQYEGYRDAEGVAEGSETPTYAAVKAYVDNWRWQGVPFYLRSGKALNEKTTQIIIQFKRVPHNMFPTGDAPIRRNYIAICIQPHEGIHMRIEAKVPDTEAEMRDVDMEFHYDDDFEGIILPQAYERLLMEALEGDATLFTRSDGIEAAWTFIDGILEGWKTEHAPPVHEYTPGSWGPEAADTLLTRKGHYWRHGCMEH